MLTDPTPKEKSPITKVKSSLCSLSIAVPIPVTNRTLL